MTIRAGIAALFLTALLLSCGGGGGGSGKGEFGDPIVGTGPGNVPPLGQVPPSDPPAETLNLRVLRQGSGRVIGSVQHTVARTEQEYWAIWQQYFPPPPPGLGVPVEAPPVVDFTTEFVLVVSIGQRPTGGYSIEPIGITKQGDGVEYVYEERQPSANCVVIQAITGPVLFIAVTPRWDGSVTFVPQVRIVDC